MKDNQEVKPNQVNAGKGPGKGKDRQNAVTVRLNAVSLKTKRK